MTDLHKAEAAAREALADFDQCPSVVENDDAARAAIDKARDLLAALDAARGQAVWQARLTTKQWLDLDGASDALAEKEQGVEIRCLYAAPPAAADSLRAMSDWLESGEYRVSFNGDESYPLLIGGALYAPGKPPRVVFECEQAPPAAAVSAANVTPMRQPRADLARLVESINAAVYANGDGLSVTEAIGALELAKLELFKEQEQ